MLNPIRLMKIYSGLDKLDAVMKEKGPMTSSKILQIGVILTGIAGAANAATVANGFVHQHVILCAVLYAVAQVLHAVLPSIFNEPNQSGAPAAASKLGVMILAICGMLMLPAAKLQAQTGADPGAIASPVQNFYAAGLSYTTGGGSTPLAGTAAWAHNLNNGTYSLAVLDAVPSTVKPLTVTTNLGAGIAQKVFTISGYPVYMPVAAGFSWSGANAGFQWSGGGFVPVKIKNGYSVVVSLRYLKSAVSNGTGYQLIPGVWVGWGK